jgi:hypothetical protein
MKIYFKCCNEAPFALDVDPNQQIIELKKQLVLT